jgi:hypothetical protein
MCHAIVEHAAVHPSFPRRAYPIPLPWQAVFETIAAGIDSLENSRI